MQLTAERGHLRKHLRILDGLTTEAALTHEQIYDLEGLAHFLSCVIAAFDDGEDLVEIQRAEDTE